MIRRRFIVRPTTSRYAIGFPRSRSERWWGRLVALLLIPCLAGDALIPAGAAAFGKWDAALVANPVTAAGLQYYSLAPLGERDGVRGLTTPSQLPFEQEALSIPETFAHNAAENVAFRIRRWLGHGDRTQVGIATADHRFRPSLFASLPKNRWLASEALDPPHGKADQLRLFHELTAYQSWRSVPSRHLCVLKGFVEQARRDYPDLAAVYLNDELLQKRLTEPDGVRDVVRRVHPYTLQALHEKNAFTSWGLMHEMAYYWLYARRLLGTLPSGGIPVVNVDAHADSLHRLEYSEEWTNRNPVTGELTLRGVTDANWAGAAVQDGLASQVIGLDVFGHSLVISGVTQRNQDGKVYYPSKHAQSLAEAGLQGDTLLTVDLDTFSLDVFQSFFERRPHYEPAQVKEWMIRLTNLLKETPVRLIGLVIASSPDYLSRKDRSSIAYQVDALTVIQEEVEKAFSPVLVAAPAHSPARRPSRMEAPTPAPAAAAPAGLAKDATYERFPSLGKRGTELVAAPIVEAPEIRDMAKAAAAKDFSGLRRLAKRFLAAHTRNVTPESRRTRRRGLLRIVRWTLNAARFGMGLHWIVNWVGHLVYNWKHREAALAKEKKPALAPTAAPRARELARLIEEYKWTFLARRIFESTLRAQPEEAFDQRLERIGASLDAECKLRDLLGSFFMWGKNIADKRWTIPFFVYEALNGEAKAQELIDRLFEGVKPNESGLFEAPTLNRAIQNAKQVVEWLAGQGYFEKSKGYFPALFEQREIVDPFEFFESVPDELIIGQDVLMDRSASAPAPASAPSHRGVFRRPALIVILLAVAYLVAGSASAHGLGDLVPAGLLQALPQPFPHPFGWGPDTVEYFLPLVAESIAVIIGMESMGRRWTQMMNILDKLEPVRQAIQRWPGELSLFRKIYKPLSRITTYIFYSRDGLEEKYKTGLLSNKDLFLGGFISLALILIGMGFLFFPGGDFWGHLAVAGLVGLLTFGLLQPLEHRGFLNRWTRRIGLVALLAAFSIIGNYLFGLTGPAFQASSFSVHPAPMWGGVHGLAAYTGFHALALAGFIPSRLAAPESPGVSVDASSFHGNPRPTAGADQPGGVPARALETISIDELRAYVQAINSALQEVLAREIPEQYPALCRTSALVSRILLQKQFGDAFRIRFFEGRKIIATAPGGVVHNWLEPELGGRRYYLSFSDGPFQADASLLSLEKERHHREFLAEFKAHGLDGVELLEIEGSDEDFYRRHHIMDPVESPEQAGKKEHIIAQLVQDRLSSSATPPDDEPYAIEPGSWHGKWYGRLIQEDNRPLGDEDQHKLWLIVVELIEAGLLECATSADVFLRTLLSKTPQAIAEFVAFYVAPYQETLTIMDGIDKDIRAAKSDRALTKETYKDITAHIVQRQVDAGMARHRQVAAAFSNSK